MMIQSYIFQRSRKRLVVYCCLERISTTASQIQGQSKCAVLMKLWKVKNKCLYKFTKLKYFSAWDTLIKNMRLKKSLTNVIPYHVK